MRNFTIAVTTLSLVAAAFTDAQADGPGLSQQMRSYWAWALTGKPPARVGTVAFLPPAEGVADVERGGHVVHVGTAEATLRKDQPFFLPIYSWIAESYADDRERVAAVPPASAFTSADVRLELDGVAVFDSRKDDLRRAYVDKAYFRRPLRYPSPTPYGATGASWVRGLGVRLGPLPVGTHRLHLHVASDWLDAGGGSARFETTWTLTVAR